MKVEEVLKDILDYKITSQILYNESIINIQNPEGRQLFKQLRDDEMRDIVKLQQIINRLTYDKPNIISKIFPNRPRY